MGVLLVASFARAPARFPAWLAAPMLRVLFAVPPPAWLLRGLLLGPGAPAPLVALLRRALRGVLPRVLAHRVAEVLRVDVTEPASKAQVPVRYLRAAGDRVVPARCGELLLTGCPGLGLEDLPGPHLLAQRHPRAVAACLDAWRAEPDP